LDSKEKKILLTLHFSFRIHNDTCIVCRYSILLVINTNPPNTNQIENYENILQNMIQEFSTLAAVSSFRIQTGIPSKYMNTPSLRLHGLRCRTITAGITFFRRSGFPFFTVAITMSPTAAAGSLFRRPFTPFTEIT
jgi:hypothetical protein